MQGEAEKECVCARITSMDEKFNTDYTRLNKAQREAVDTIEGPVMVIAGPGTGKTQVLTLRIANIIRTTDTAPENILALTFTEAGARAMRERLRGYIGNRAHKVAIHTFHEFAGTLIRAYPDAYDRAIGGRPATDLEKVAFVEEILERDGIKLLRPRGNPRFYVMGIIGTVALMKREYITPVHFAEIIAQQETKLSDMPKVHEKGAHKGKVRSEYQKFEKEIAKNRELLFVYRAYDAVLREQHLYDFEDMIYETVQALEQNEDMLRDVQERFQYLLADEHQDVNGSQNRILELLASFHERPNIFVVGDEKQAIFRFQGASLENFLYFEERFPHTKTIALTDNYRSTQNILDIAHALITEEETPAAALRIPLTAVQKNVGVVEWRAYTHEAIEDDSLVHHIQALRSTTPLSEIAVLVRSNREVEHYTQLLRAAGLSVDPSADGDILRNPITVSVRTLVRALLEPSNEEVLFTLLHEPCWGIAVDDLVRLARERNFARPLAGMIYDEDAMNVLTLRHSERVVRVGKILTKLRNQIPVTAPHRLIAQALTEIGFVDHLMQHDPFEGGRVLRRLYDEIESLVCAREATTLQDIARMFALRLEHNLPLSAPYISVGGEAVQVMTVHKSKGLEFAHVYVPHLTDTTWGDTTHAKLFRIPITTHVDDTAFDALDDERKLLYVALTRAKEGLHLSYANENVAGRTQSETPLLETIHEEFATTVASDTDTATFNPVSVFAASERIGIDSAILTEILRERGLSATSLNNYVEDPWQYLYRNVLRIPEVKSESAQFGTAVHGTLALITQYRREKGKMPSVSEYKTMLERELTKLPITVEEYTRFHEDGLIAVTHYLEAVAPAFSGHTREEAPFEVFLKTGDPTFPEIKLTGSLDRLDFDKAYNEGGQLIRVIDYKTGKPKTRGQIEGTTKDSEGGYKRQLVFYALMLSLQEDERLKTRSFRLSFVEADEKGKIHEEDYTITDEEIAELSREIVRVAREIRTGVFLAMPCDPESEYAHLVSLLQQKRAE